MSIKNIHRALMLLLFLSIIPIIIIAFYNYPCADDFAASDSVKTAWTSTGSLIAVFKEIIANVWHNYRNWSGVFMSVFWTTMQPGIFNEKYYGIVTVLTVVLLMTATFYTFSVVLQKYLRIEKELSDCISVIFLFLILQYMPDGNEGLYWHAGVVNYTWAFAFFLFLLGIELSMWLEKFSKKKILKMIVAIFLFLNFLPFYL